jgi:hypothetical protein
VFECLLLAQKQLPTSGPAPGWQIRSASTAPGTTLQTAMQVGLAASPVSVVIGCAAPHLSAHNADPSHWMLPRGTQSSWAESCSAKNPVAPHAGVKAAVSAALAMSSRHCGPPCSAAASGAASDCRDWPVASADDLALGFNKLAVSHV